MCMATVVMSPQAQQEAAGLPKPIRARLYRVVERLQNWPDVSGARPLRGDLAGRYRIRTGDYRVQFRVTGDTVVIERVGHRDRFYD